MRGNLTGIRGKGDGSRNECQNLTSDHSQTHVTTRTSNYRTAAGYGTRDRFKNTQIEDIFVRKRGLGWKHTATCEKNRPNLIALEKANTKSHSTYGGMGELQQKGWRDSELGEDGDMRGQVIMGGKEKGKNWNGKLKKSSLKWKL